MSRAVGDVYSPGSLGWYGALWCPVAAKAGKGREAGTQPSADASHSGEEGVLLALRAAQFFPVGTVLQMVRHFADPAH